MSIWIVIFKVEPSLRSPPQRRQSLIGRASIESTRVVVASYLPLLHMQGVNNSFKFLT